MEGKLSNLLVYVYSSKRNIFEERTVLKLVQGRNYKTRYDAEKAEHTCVLHSVDWRWARSAKKEGF